jgi:hypothetical protein
VLDVRATRRVAACPFDVRSVLVALALAFVAPATASANDVDENEVPTNVVDEDELPPSPQDLDAELERLDPTRTANLFRGLGLELDPFEEHTLRSLLAPRNPRIIDVDLMHARDCLLDRIHGGQCVLRGFDEEPESIDVSRYGDELGQRQRFEVLERMIDALQPIDP